MYENILLYLYLHRHKRHTTDKI